MFSLCWALQIFFAKLGFLQGVTVLSFQAVLFITATITLGVLVLPKTGKDIVHLLKDNPAMFWKLFLANAIQSGLGTCLSIIGIALTDAINAGFLVKLSAVTTTLFAWMLLRERMSWLKMTVIVSMLTGAYLLTTKGQTLYPQIGDVFIFSACVCWSLGSVLVRKYLREYSIKPDVVTIQKPAASLPVLAGFFGVSFFFPEKLGMLSEVLSCCTFTPDVLLYGLVSGFCLAMAWIYLYRTLKISTASYMTLMSMVTPVIVSILAIAFLGEWFVWVQGLGAGLILLSGVVIYYSDIVKV
jgi:drug/metabolite transporter (DMT)-like permease